MNEHEGYLELGLVGFTDKGEYSPDETYVKNDLVHLNNAIWKCLQDNTSGIEPAKNENWSVFVASENDLSGITAVDEHGVLGDESAQVPAEDLVNALAAPEFDDSGTVDGISGFQDFLDKVKSKMKLLDFFKNFAAGMKFVLHAGQLVNNCTSESADLPLAAAQGKVLMDLYTQLNSNLQNKANLLMNIDTTQNTDYFANVQKGYTKAPVGVSLATIFQNGVIFFKLDNTYGAAIWFGYNMRNIGYGVLENGTWAQKS